MESMTGSASAASAASAAAGSCPSPAAYLSSGIIYVFAFDCTTTAFPAATASVIFTYTTALDWRMREMLL
jgi:hypothetical protein